MTTQYPLQDDELFMQNFKLQIFYMRVSIIIIVVPMEISLLFIMHILHISFHWLTCLLCLGCTGFALITGIFGIVNLKKVWHTTCFLTSKRLYLKTTKDGDYVSFNKEDVSSISTKWFGMTIERDNSEIITIPIPQSEHKHIVEILQKP